MRSLQRKRWIIYDHGTRNLYLLNRERLQYGPTL